MYFRFDQRTKFVVADQPSCLCVTANGVERLRR
jgi:hypothetical protein